MTEIDWDAPEWQPPRTYGMKMQPGTVVHGVISDITADTTGRYPGLRYRIDGLRYRANSRLWATIREARIQNGETVRITRLPDTPPAYDGMNPASNWQVERIDAHKAPPTTSRPAGLAW